jgi:hypothetical protein
MKMRIVDKIDSSALLVMKTHQQNTLKTFISAIRALQDQKAFALRLVESCWPARGQKEPKGSAQTSSLGQTKLVWPHLLLKMMQNALTQQGKSSAAIHHALNELDPGDLPFCLCVVVNVR